MSARVALLTTDTTHHTWWTWKLGEHVELAAILTETAGSSTATAQLEFERRRDEYERDVLLADGPRSLDELGPVSEFETLNDPAAITALREAHADLVIVFGTGILDEEFIASAGPPLLNLHGGNPEEYRGLDTHLWAIWHRDFANLITTLHVVDTAVDTGAIAGQAALDVGRGTPLHELRAINTRACLDLSVGAALTLAAIGRVPARPQLRRGLYYSAMPVELKEQCVERFERWTATL